MTNIFRKCVLFNTALRYVSMNYINDIHIMHSTVQDICIRKLILDDIQY